RSTPGLEPPKAPERETGPVEGQVVSGRQAHDSLEEGLVPLLEPALLQVLAHDGAIGLEADPRDEPERLRLARKRESRAVDAVVERLDAETVARAEEPLLRLVPEGERPHSVETLDAALAPLVVGGEAHLG